MNNPFFKREEFKVCDVPVPAGYPQSQTHSGIVMYDGRYYLTSSPYPGKKYSPFTLHFRALLKRLSGGLLYKPRVGEVYENPCLYIGVNDTDSAPTVFKPFAERPLMNTPELVFGLPSFNSDPEIYIEGGRAYILNRTVYRTKLLKHGYESITDIFLIEGNIGGQRFKVESINLIKEWEKPYASPCLTKFGDKYLFTYLDTNSALDAKSFNGLYMQELDSIKELANHHIYREIKVNSDDMLPWHMSLFSYQNKLFTIIACVKKGDKTRKIWQMLGEFDRGLTELTIYQTPLTDFNSYRGAALVRDNGQFSLYNTIVWEKVRGAKSVDGRDIVLAECEFMELLEKMKQ